MDWKGKKILINGVSGFIGSNLAREFISKGAEIWSIDNFSYIDSDMAKKNLSYVLSKINLIVGDVSKLETWDKVPSDIEYIFHFAAPSSITLFKKHPEKCFSETTLGFYNALEYGKKNHVKKVIYPSSGSNYAGNEFPHKENIYPQPRNLYAAAKIACEGLANCYSDFVKSIGLRIFAGYGPGEEWKKDFGSVLYLFIRDYMSGKSPEVWGDGAQTRDFIYIEDIVKMILRAAEVDYTGVVNIGTGKSVSFAKLLEIIKKILETDIKPIYIHKEKNYVDHLEADITKMREIFGIEPMRPEEGIKKFVEYLKQNE